MNRFATAPVLRSHLSGLGPAGARWLDLLPDRLELHRSHWDLRLGNVVSAGPWSVVVEAVQGRRPVVCKVTTPGSQFWQEVALLRVADGRGYVRLLDADEEHGALLMEALGPSVEDDLTAASAGLAPAEAAAVRHAEPVLHLVADTLRLAWQVPLEVAPAVDRTTHRAAQVRSQIEQVAHRLGVSGHDVAIERALLYAGQRLDAREPEREVVVHGDPHPGNLLAVPQPREGAETGHVWVDPDGFRCEPEYDLGVVVREANRFLLGEEDPVLLLRGWCAHLAAATDTDAEAIWQWAFIERVWSGLYLADHGRPEEAERFLGAADRLAGVRT